MFHKLSLNIKNIQIYLKIPMVAISRTLIIFMYSSSSMLSIEKIMHYLFKIFCTKVAKDSFRTDVGRRGDRHGERIKQLLE